ncbi:MAG: ssDNA-binding domain-containing protein [Clostridiales bacterium]|jgi:hypothetical protein|nr:ssDNA-binding domain-containing protein [Clostridiales bacterium]
MAGTPQVREITAKLEQGVKDLFESEKHAAYLKTMSRFHNYSTRNTVLIHMQFPNAKRVHGYAAWKKDFKRQVKKGERGIRILAPIPHSETKEFEKLDPATRRPVLDENGQPVMETLARLGASFKSVAVFDISQTEGEPLPELAEPLEGDVERYGLFMDALRAASPLPIVFESLPPDSDGACHFGDRIAIRAGMSQIQTVSAAIHEICHAKLDDPARAADSGGHPKDRRAEECIAESVSFTVCSAWGIETGANSFGYIADWSKGRDLKELKASLDTIRKTAAELIGGIERQYRALAKERGIDLEAAAGAERGGAGSGATAGEPGAERNRGMAGGAAGSEPPKAEETPAEETPAEPARPAAPEQTPPPEAGAAALIAAYARSAAASGPQRAGAAVLMAPVFDGMNYNREGKKIRATVEEPAGKYRLFTHDDRGYKNLYFLTASGRIERTSQFFSDDWDETSHKYANRRPAEAELDAVLPQIAARFERDMADPAKWAPYQDAAVLDRLGECDAHNAPVRKLREEESDARQAAAEQARAAEQREAREKLDARVAEIAAAIKGGKEIGVKYDAREHGGKNPVLELFRLHGIGLPLRTQGWANTTLAAITPGGYRRYTASGGKKRGESEAFGERLCKLKEAIKLAPAEENRGKPAVRAEANNAPENEPREKPRGAPPGFASGGSPAPQEPGKPEKLYDLGYGFLGNGITVWNRAEETNGDYKTMAHISTERETTVYDKDMPESVRARIEAAAQSPDTWAFGFKPAPEAEKPAAGYLSFADSGETVAYSSADELAAAYKREMGSLGAEGVRFGGVTDSALQQRLAALHAAEYGIDASEEAPAPQPEKPAEAAPGPPPPDPAVTAAAMNEYGYTEPDMHPLSAGRAAELFDAGHPIYLLYPDSTEALALDRDEIAAFSGEGFCGIAKADWEASPARAAQAAIAASAENSREAGLLFGGESKFGIYQIKDGAGGARDLRFAPMRELEALGLRPDRANYELAHTGRLGIRDTLSNANNIFSSFQRDSPECPPDFAGRSVSVSDVIVLQWRGEVSAHYVDSAGFRELPSFTGSERPQRQQAQQQQAQRQEPPPQQARQEPRGV